MNKILELKFDPNTIEHLGVSLYSQLPSVLSELISNSWDADADSVKVDFITSSTCKEISVKDDGHGMTFDELNDEYLVVGRNRRKSGSSKTAKGRKPIGKKGLGKLSVFGICDSVSVRSVKSGLANQFVLDLELIKSSKSNSYQPKIIEHSVATSEPDGTEIILKGIRRKSPFRIDETAVSISKKFTVLDELNLIFLENGKNPTRVRNEDKFRGMNTQFKWSFPSEEFGKSYPHYGEIVGEIITLETPVKDTEMRGIYLVSRGKIVNSASFFGLRDNDQFHNYVTGYLHIDFIDDLLSDLISTDRHSLNWEHDESRELQEYLHEVIKGIGRDWKKKRQHQKRDQLKSERSLDIEEWQKTLPTYERDLSDKIINPILTDNNIASERASIIIGGVIDKFNNKAFKDYASNIADISREEDIPRFIELIEEWKLIEAKQFRDLSRSRVEVIKKFEEHIANDTKEVPTLHNFLKKFSWLLDPRILEFRDEVTYSRLLKESFPESGLDEKSKRIDFLCSNALGEILYVIEIKKSKYKVDKKALEQAYEYGAFLRNKYASQTGFSKVVCFVVGGEKSDDYLFKDKEETYMKSGEVFVKTYRELLEQSKEYHREFIETYDKFNPDGT